jgi:DNA processing protein
MNLNNTRSTLSSSEKIQWIRLSRSENVGKATFFRLLEIYGSASAALEKISDQAIKGGLNREIKICSEKEVEKELENSKKMGAEIILFCEEKYPRLLREIEDPAPILTVKGKTEFLNQHAIAVVGPRNASFNGVAFARKIAADLGDNSLIVTSGMAKGIDAAAHEASLNSGTIAVIAGGIDHIYPTENTELYHKISKQGLIVSESPFGVPPKGGNFIQRNRIISGLSLGVVVVEAGLRSGSLTTARFAGEQGREIFSVPGSPFDPRCHGTNRLIKQGAKLTENIDDILEELIALKARFGEAQMMQEPEAEEFIAAILKMPSDDDIKKVREEILTKLSFVPISIEAIITELRVPPRLVNIAVIQLELADKAEVRFGKVALKAV